MDQARAVRGIVRSALTAAVRGAVVSCSFGRIAETAAIGHLPPLVTHAQRISRFSHGISATRLVRREQSPVDAVSKISL